MKEKEYIDRIFDDELEIFPNMLSNLNEDVPEGLHSSIMKQIKMEQKIKPLHTKTSYRKFAVMAASLLVFVYSLSNSPSFKLGDESRPQDKRHTNTTAQVTPSIKVANVIKPTPTTNITKKQDNVKVAMVKENPPSVKHHPASIKTHSTKSKPKLPSMKHVEVATNNTLKQKPSTTVAPTFCRPDDTSKKDDLKFTYTINYDMSLTQSQLGEIQELPISLIVVDNSDNNFVYSLSATDFKILDNYLNENSISFNMTNQPLNDEVFIKITMSDIK